MTSLTLKRKLSRLPGTFVLVDACLETDIAHHAFFGKTVLRF